MGLVEGDGAGHGVGDLVVGDEDHPLLRYLGMVIRFNECYLLQISFKNISVPIEFNLPSS